MIIERNFKKIKEVLTDGKNVSRPKLKFFILKEMMYYLVSLNKSLI